MNYEQSDQSPNNIKYSIVNFIHQVQLSNNSVSGTIKSFHPVFAFISILTMFNTFAVDKHIKPYDGSTELQKMKSLAGKWQGWSQMKDENIDVSLEYAVSSAGSALIETLFMGTPHEMVSVYHDEEGKLAMT